MTKRTPAAERLRLLAAEDQATAAAAPLLRLDVFSVTDRELEQARLVLGEAKLAIRRVAIAAGLCIDPDAGRVDRATMDRLKPYNAVLDAIKYEEEDRQADAGRSRREVYDRRRAETAPRAHVCRAGCPPVDDQRQRPTCAGCVRALTQPRVVPERGTAIR